MSQSRNEIRSTDSLIVECVGTFMFLSVIALSSRSSQFGALGIGAALIALSFLGGYYNPAVTFALFLRGQLSASGLIARWVVQVASGILGFCFGYVLSGHIASVAPGTTVTTGQALGAEILFSAAWCLVVLVTLRSPSRESNALFGSFAAGLIVVAGILAVRPISGAVFNPAVGVAANLAGAVFGHGGWSHLWIYILGPLIGATLAAITDMVSTSASGRGEMETTTATET